MDFVGFGEKVLLEVVAVAAAVDDQEILVLADRRQHAVPEVARIVHALAGMRQEGMRLAGAVRRRHGRRSTRKGRGDSGTKAWLPNGWRSTMVSFSGNS